MGKDKRIIVTGGAGFIGSAVVRQLVSKDYQVLNLDKLTYAGNLESLESVESRDNYRFRQVDICNRESVEAVFESFRPTSIIHLAAESHVDRSIDGPAEFINTNIVGTGILLEVSRKYWKSKRRDFKFHHVSTDEVYGSLGEHGFFIETSPYQPSSPYSASKAASDHLVRAWHETYGLPVVVTNCSNNYGPYQFPEKLIPLVILNALEGKPLPIYGKGDQVRDWLYVDDHALALILVMEQGKAGETYNIGGLNEQKNIDVVKHICRILDRKVANHPAGIGRFEQLIKFVEDRPGHDQRYAIEANKIKRELGWVPQENFATGLEKTIDWYLSNRTWCGRVLDGSYRRERLGLHEG